MFCKYLLQMVGAKELYKTQTALIDNWRAKNEVSLIARCVFATLEFCIFRIVLNWNVPIHGDSWCHKKKFLN